MSELRAEGAPMRLTCGEVEDVAALYVIDALSDQEASAVAAHLSTCPHAHPSYTELAPLGTVLAGSIDPVDAPAPLRGRILAAVATTPQVPDPVPGASSGTTATSRPAAVAGTAPQGAAGDGARPGLLERLFGGGGSRGWVAAAAMGLVLVLVGVGLVTTLQRSQSDAQRLTLLADAVRQAASGTADVATLTGSGAAAGAGGYAVFPEDEAGYIVVSGLPPLASEQAFQAWFIADGAPVSAGLLEVSADGLGTLTGLSAAPGTSVVALTVEPSSGSDAPTSDPIVVGELPIPA